MSAKLHVWSAGSIDTLDAVDELELQVSGPGDPIDRIAVHSGKYTKKRVSFFFRREDGGYYLDGTMDANGRVTYRSATYPDSETRYASQDIEYVVERFGNSIDYLLERYFARMDEGTYVVKDPPRMNPTRNRRVNPLRALWLRHVR